MGRTTGRMLRSLTLVLLFGASAGAEDLTALRQRAEQGQVAAQLRLAYLHQAGQGTPRSPEEAARWYRRAAEQGDWGAQFSLGRLYETGQGVPQDHAQAARWYGEAAAQGDPYAQYNLGLLFRRGLGVPAGREAQYRDAGLWWWRRAAAQGHAEAVAQLALAVAAVPSPAHD